MKLRVGILMLAMLGTAHAGIYRSVDENGVVHFDDQMTPGAQEVKLRDVQTYEAPTQDPAKPAPVIPADVKRYKSVVITQPSDKNTVRNNDGSLAITVELEPQLQPHHKVQILLDGQPAGEPQVATTFSLKDIYRGTHTVQANVLDGKGTTINESAPVTFTMHRPMDRGPAVVENPKAPVVTPPSR